MVSFLASVAPHSCALRPWLMLPSLTDLLKNRGTLLWRVPTKQKRRHSLGVKLTLHQPHWCYQLRRMTLPSTTSIVKFSRIYQNLFFSLIVLRTSNLSILLNYITIKMSWLSKLVRGAVGDDTYYKKIRPVWRHPSKIIKTVGVKVSHNGNDGWKIRPMNPFWSLTHKESSYYYTLDG